MCQYTIDYFYIMSVKKNCKYVTQPLISSLKITQSTIGKTNLKLVQPTKENYI